jgi:hypothetical protein
MSVFTFDDVKNSVKNSVKKFSKTMILSISLKRISDGMVKTNFLTVIITYNIYMHFTLFKNHIKHCVEH